MSMDLVLLIQDQDQTRAHLTFFFFTSSGFSLGTSAALHYGEKYVWKICLTLVDEYRSSHYMIQSTQDPNSPTTVTAGVYSDSHFVFRNNSNF